MGQPNPVGKSYGICSPKRACISTNPRDRIFALKALMPSGGHELGRFVDYDRSVEVVFTDIVEYLFSCVQLWLLLALQHPNLTLPHLSSWVSDWSGNLTLRAQWYHGHVPKASSDLDLGSSSEESDIEDCDLSHPGDEEITKSGQHKKKRR